MTLTSEELTGTEQAVLLVLMAESRPVANAELGSLGPELKKPSREKLNRLKLIETSTVGRGLVHELTDTGWRRCQDLFGADAPPRSSGQGKALYALLAALGRYFIRTDQRIAEVFLPRDSSANRSGAITGAGTDGQVEDQVRDAYLRLAGRPGGWVGLVRLRAALTGVPRSELDDVLIRMYQLPGVSLIPEENQNVLTAADRQAAIEIGDQNKHLIAIEP